MEQRQSFDSITTVIDESSFIRFVEQLAAERRLADSLPLELDGFQGEWANQSIADFLSAAADWAKDSSFGQRPGPKPSNNWQLFAQFKLIVSIFST